MPKRARAEADEPLPWTPLEDAEGQYTWRCAAYTKNRSLMTLQEDGYIMRKKHEYLPDLVYLCRPRTNLVEHRFAIVSAVRVRHDDDVVVVVLGASNVGERFVARDVVASDDSNFMASSILLQIDRGLETYTINGRDIVLSYY